jgi:hypothetical protein
MATYGRSYRTIEEMLHRARVFADNLAHINAINANPANTWSAAVNKLADQTTEEISRLKVNCCLPLKCFIYLPFAHHFVRATTVVCPDLCTLSAISPARLSTCLTSPRLSTGAPTIPLWSLKSRTKVAADRAGLSALPKLWSLPLLSLAASS